MDLRNRNLTIRVSNDGDSIKLRESSVRKLDKLGTPLKNKRLSEFLIDPESRQTRYGKITYSLVDKAECVIVSEQDDRKIQGRWKDSKS